MNDIVLDFERQSRCGVDEAIFCEGKTTQQLVEIVTLAQQHQRRLLMTRLTAEKWHSLPEAIRQQLHYQPQGWTATLGPMQPLHPAEHIALVSGGASDQRICCEISTTLQYHGYDCCRFEDIGVAALWRLNQRLPQIKRARLIIAVAGMEAALATVLCGLVATPIIAVPTSVGYGVAAGGTLALHALLGSCAAGITVVNIDNGFGAACAAVRMLKMAQDYPR